MPYESFLNPRGICSWLKVTYNKSGKRSWIDHENKWKNEIAWSPNLWTNDFPAPSIRRFKTNLSVTEILERTLCTWQVECHEKVQEKYKYMPPHFLLPEKEWYSRMCSVKNLACRIDTLFICCSPDLAVTKFPDEGFLTMLIVLTCMSTLRHIDLHEVSKTKQKWNSNKIMLLDTRNKTMALDCMSTFFEPEMKAVLL